jgi:hypothetical protein
MLPQAVKEGNRTSKTIIKSRGKAKAANSRVALVLHVQKVRDKQAVRRTYATPEEKGICFF